MAEGVHKVYEGAIASNASTRGKASTPKLIRALNGAHLRIGGQEYLEAVIDLVPSGFVGGHAPPDMVGPFKDQYGETGLREPMRGSQSGEPSPYNDHISVGKFCHT
jgi:hypothetical protein